MLKTVEDICRDEVSRSILNLLFDGWMPIKLLINKLNVDRHTVYRRFKALRQHNLIEKSKRKHEVSRYKIFGFSLTESGKVLVQADRTSSPLRINFTMHSFEMNYKVDTKLYVYPNSEASTFTSNIVRYNLNKGVSYMVQQLTRDPNVNLGNCRLIFDCKFETIAEFDVYEFYNDCLAPSLDSYVSNRTFGAEKQLSVRIFRSPSYAVELIKLARFTSEFYFSEIGKENIDLIKTALDTATEQIESKGSGWTNNASSLIINAYLFMLASIYHVRGKLPDPEKYFELWYTAIYNLKKLKRLYSPLLKDLKRKIAYIHS